MLKLWVQIMSGVDAMRRDDRGAVAAEYGLLLALIAVALVLAIEGLTGAISAAFGEAADVLTGSGD